MPIVNRVAAGEGVDTVESEAGPPGWASEYVALDDPPAGAIAVRVVGDSMEPRYTSGDLLVVDPAVAASPGEPAVVIYEDPGGGDWSARAVVKIFQPARKWVHLQSLNSAAPDIQVAKSAIRRAYAVWRHLPAIIAAGD